MDITPLMLLFFFFTSVYVVTVYAVSIIGVKFMKKIADCPRDYNYQPKVSVMISCFNEGEVILQTIDSIMRSNYPPDRLQIVAFDDCSKDDTMEWLERAAMKYPANVFVKRNAENKGKAWTMLDISEVCTGDILIGTDSDCVFHENAIRELCACFADPKMGGVGGLIKIHNVNDTLLSQAQTMLYGMSYWMAKPMENVTRTVQCLGGPLVAFRREVYMGLHDEIRNINFLGNKTTNGEDRYITQFLIFGGWKTYVNFDAQCWVGTPTSWGAYLKQQLRWRRSAIGQYFWCLGSLRTRIKQGGFIATMGSLFPITINFSWNLFAFYMYCIGSFPQFIATFLCLHALGFPVIALVFNWLCKHHGQQTQVMKNPVLAAFAYTIWFPVSCFFVTPWAAATLTEGGWVTRQNGAKGNI